MRQIAQFGSVYLTVADAASTASAKVATGSLDPSTVSGVALAVNDLWESTTSGVAFGYGLSPYGTAPYGS